MLISYQLKLIKMRAKLANLNDCAVLFLSRAAANLRGTTIQQITLAHTGSCFCSKYNCTMLTMIVLVKYADNDSPRNSFFSS